MELREAINFLEYYKSQLSQSRHNDIYVKHITALDTLIAHAKQPVQVTDEMIEIVAEVFIDAWIGEGNYDGMKDDNSHKQYAKEKAKAALQAALGVGLL